jgi:hypothetical protein
VSVSRAAMAQLKAIQLAAIGGRPRRNVIA